MRLAVSFGPRTTTKHTFHVVVNDHKHQPTTDAKVAIVRTASVEGQHHPFDAVKATHRHEKDGNYLGSGASPPSEGDWLLVVHAHGKSTVVQPFRLVAKHNGSLGVEYRPARVATVSTTVPKRTVGAAAEHAITFQVTMYAATELVYIAGVNYHNPDVSTGSQFHLFAFDRAEALLRQHALNPGTIVTVFSTASGWKTTRVMGASGWVDLEVLALGDPKMRRIPVEESEHYKPKAGVDIPITAFYKYLDDLGRRAPKTVIDAGIFSHSWPGGPILYNTNEGEEYKPINTRDPLDFDARVKDFYAENMTGWPKMRDAFSERARFTIWGCSATTHYKALARACVDGRHKGADDDALFRVRTETRERGSLLSSLEERTSIARHRWAMDVLFRRGTYPAAAASCLGIEVRAGCPGTGTDLRNDGGIKFMSVNLHTYEKVFEFFRASFSPEFRETNARFDQGYVDYSALQRRPPVERPAFQSGYCRLQVRHVGKWDKENPASLLQFWNGKVVKVIAPVSLRHVWQVSGLVESGVAGHVFELRDYQGNEVRFVLMQEDGKAFLVLPDGRNGWNVGERLL